MEQKKRKISVRRILQVLVTVIVTTGCIIAIAGASKIEGDKYVSKIVIQIKNNTKCHFIDKQEILNMLINDRHLDMQHMPITMLDVRSMERIISSNPWVGAADVYVDNQRLLHVNVSQRVPVARVFEEDGNSYYLDTALRSMPLSPKYIYYTTVVTGVPALHDDSVGNSWKAQIIYLVKQIEKDTFWNAQVSQIVMTPDRSFELVPVLGKQRIIIGDTSRMQEKLDNLFSFYTKILNRVGWDRYDVIDLRYAGQVVASPALPWNAPVDKAMSSMNWVKSILDAASKNGDDAMPDTSNATPIHTVSHDVVEKPQVASATVSHIAAPLKVVENKPKETHTIVTAAPPPPPPAAAAAQLVAKEAKKPAPTPVIVPKPQSKKEEHTVTVAAKPITKPTPIAKEVKKEEKAAVATPIIKKEEHTAVATKTPAKPAPATKEVKKEEKSTVAKAPVKKEERPSATKSATVAKKEIKKEEKPAVVNVINTGKQETKPAKPEEHKATVAEKKTEPVHKQPIGPQPDEPEAKVVAAKAPAAKPPPKDEHKAAIKKDDKKKDQKKPAAKKEEKKTVPKAKPATKKQTSH